MTEREEEILNLIRKDPMISQQKVAETLEITRSSVSVHITNLIKKGLIKGRGYIIDENEYVTIIGAACMDMHGFTSEKLLYEDSNPGAIKVSCGGVGRNVAENLSRMDICVKLITSLGEDMYGKKIIDESKICGIDVNDSLILSDGNTSMYMSILDNDGDMKLALCDAKIIERITIDFIKSKSHILNNSRIIILDTGLTQEVIEYIVNNFKNIPIFLDPVSIKRSGKIKNLLGYFDTLKLNKHEAEYISAININGMDDLERASKFFLDSGVKNVFITLSKDGVYYRNSTTTGFLKAPNVKVVNATGAGDSFMAGLVYSRIKGLDIHNSAIFSTAASIISLSHENTINPSISVESIKNKIKELEIC